jgi:hypothetical protein
MGLRKLKITRLFVNVIHFLTHRSKALKLFYQKSFESNSTRPSVRPEFQPEEGAHRRTSYTESHVTAAKSRVGINWQPSSRLCYSDGNQRNQRLGDDLDDRSAPAILVRVVTSHPPTTERPIGCFFDQISSNFN